MPVSGQAVYLDIDVLMLAAPATVLESEFS